MGSKSDESRINHIVPSTCFEDVVKAIAYLEQAGTIAAQTDGGKGWVHQTKSEFGMKFYGIQVYMHTKFIYKS